MHFETRERLKTSFEEYYRLQSELDRFGLDREERRRIHQRLNVVRPKLIP